MESALPRFASALSVSADHATAFHEAVDGIREGLAGAKPNLVLAFVSHHMGDAIDDLGPRLARALGTEALIGCTGESIVGSAREVEGAAALSVWAARLPGTEVRTFTASVRSEGPATLRFEGLPEIGDRARASALVLADPFSFPVPEFLEVLNESQPGLPLVGGLASGGAGPGQNLLLTAEGVVDGGAVGVVLEGAVEIVPVVSQGCRPVGKPLVITGCEENLILKLGGKPAIDALMEMHGALDKRERELFEPGPLLGLAVDASKSRFERGDFLVRAILSLVHEKRAIAVADSGIRNGMTVQFHVRDARTAGEDLSQLLRARSGATPPATGAMGALLFTCNGRGRGMFGRPNHDISCVQSSFAAPLPVAGFFAAGEIGPIGGHNCLHGFTASVALFRQRA